jgi:iron complex transport system substrate-binding protein
MTPTHDPRAVDELEPVDIPGLSRREFLVGAAVLGSLLVACSRSGDSTEPSTPGSGAAGPWTFVDDRGVEVSLPSTPTRIVTEADAAAALWDLGIEPVGIFASAPLDKVHQIDHVDLSTVESVGESYGEINLEKLAAIDPDLVVCVWYKPDEYLYGFKNPAQQTQLEQIAPTVGINAHVVADVAIERFAELADSLGVDLNAPNLKAQRERFESSSAELTKIAEDSGLTVLAIYPAIDELYVLKPEGSADLALIQQLGVNMVEPDTDNPYYDIISWENADKYPADVIVMDARVNQVEDGGFASLPTWKQLPAVQAGQIGTWVTPAPFSWRAHADVFETLSALLERSQAVAG